VARSSAICRSIALKWNFEATSSLTIMADVRSNQWIKAILALVIAVYCACLLAYLLTPRSEQTVRGLGESATGALQATPLQRPTRYFDI
jgi:hypothetical protein